MNAKVLFSLSLKNFELVCLLRLRAAAANGAIAVSAAAVAVDDATGLDFDLPLSLLSSRFVRHSLTHSLSQSFVLQVQVPARRRLSFNGLPLGDPEASQKL